MQYILGLLLLLAVFGYIVRKLTNRSERKRMEKNFNNYVERNEYTKKQKEYFAGENKPDNKPLMINGKGKLIEMDSHFDGILDDKQ